jgi:hypothetical protein
MGMCTSGQPMRWPLSPWCVSLHVRVQGPRARGMAAGMPAVGLRAYDCPLRWIWQPLVQIWWSRCCPIVLRAEVVP